MSESNSDRHVRRTAEDYAAAFMALLPSGVAWPRDPEAVLTKFINGLAGIWGPIDGRAADLLERETDPRITEEMLLDWERAFGLPDPCLNEPIDAQTRRKILVQRMTLLGAQSRQFFTDIAEDLGYTIKIREYAPFIAGISRCGITLDSAGYPRWQLGPTINRFYWKVKIEGLRLVYFRTGQSRAGEKLLRIARATDLECIIDRWKPAHTKVIFDYSAPLHPIAPAVFVDEDAFYAASIVGPKPILAALHADTDNMYSATIAGTRVEPALHVDVDIIHYGYIERL